MCFVVKPYRLRKNLCNGEPWYPDIPSTRIFAAGMNDLLFDGKLPPFSDIIIKRYRKIWGKCRAFPEPPHRPILLLAYRFPHLDSFLETLAHEQIHLYQIVTEGKMTHGRSFMRWKPILREYIETPLGVGK